MTKLLAWLAAVTILLVGVAGVVFFIHAIITAWREFGYLGEGYWWKKAISWKKVSIFVPLTVALLAFGVVGVVALCCDPAMAP